MRDNPNFSRENALLSFNLLDGHLSAAAAAPRSASESFFFSVILGGYPFFFITRLLHFPARRKLAKAAARRYLARLHYPGGKARGACRKLGSIENPGVLCFTVPAYLVVCVCMYARAASQWAGGIIFENRSARGFIRRARARNCIVLYGALIYRFFAENAIR